MHGVLTNMITMETPVKGTFFYVAGSQGMRVLLTAHCLLQRRPCGTLAGIGPALPGCYCRCWIMSAAESCSCRLKPCTVVKCLVMRSYLANGIRASFVMVGSTAAMHSYIAGNAIWTPIANAGWVWRTRRFVHHFSQNGSL